MSSDENTSIVQTPVNFHYLIVLRDHRNDGIAQRFIGHHSRSGKPYSSDFALKASLMQASKSTLHRAQSRTE